MQPHVEHATWYVKPESAGKINPNALLRVPSESDRPVSQQGLERQKANNDEELRRRREFLLSLKLEPRAVNKRFFSTHAGLKNTYEVERRIIDNE